MQEYAVYAILAILLWILTVIGLIGRAPAFIKSDPAEGRVYDERKLSRASGVFTLVIAAELTMLAVLSYRQAAGLGAYNALVGKVSIAVLAIVGLVALVVYAEKCCRK